MPLYAISTIEHSGTVYVAGSDLLSLPESDQQQLLAAGAAGTERPSLEVATAAALARAQGAVGSLYQPVQQAPYAATLEVLAAAGITELPIDLPGNVEVALRSAGYGDNRPGSVTVFRDLLAGLYPAI